MRFLHPFLSWSILLIAGSLASFYGHWQLFIRYVPDIPRITEVGSPVWHTNGSLFPFLQTISTMFQSLMSIVKLLYFLLAPRKFYELLRRVCRHELLLQCEVFGVVSGVLLLTTCWSTCHLMQLLPCCCCCSRSAHCRLAASASGGQHGTLLDQHAPPIVVLSVQLHLHYAELHAQLAGQQSLSLPPATARAIRDCAT